MGVGTLRRYHPDPAGRGKATEGDGQAPATDQAEPPAGNASADEWRTYAITVHGADPEQVAGMKRDELRDQYGPKAE